MTEGYSSYTISAANITATNTTGQTATLHAWIDFDNDGTFEDTEHASVTVNDGTDGGNPTGDLSWTGITVGAAGNTYARFRLTTDSAINNTTPGGVASDGEVEDYQIAIVDSSVSPLAGQLTINEVLYAQTGSNSAAGNDEFIELFNGSNNGIDLSGFQLIDGNLLVSVTDDPAALDGPSGSITGSQSPYVFPGGTILQPGEYAVIWIGDRNDAGGTQIPERFATGAAFQDWLGSSPKLNNTGDDVWLYDADTRVIDYMA